MATLVLSTVGTALGGPVGSAIGALVGQSIDQELLAPVRRGPRVGDLSVQTSSYGTQIPRIYGRMRVAGTVVWATDLVESSQVEGAKGQPDVTYSYSVSLAVALSARRAKSIGRIWADGKLLRGAAGDFKVDTQFRFHDGSEDQVIDPLIGSIEGRGSTPAYRGVALAVFEDLQLADFGNRIPIMTFEVIADDEPPAIASILSDASDGLIAADGADAVIGFAAYGRSIRSAIEPLVESYGIALFDDGEVLCSPQAAVPVTLGPDELGNSADGKQVARMEREQVAARELPSLLRLTYYDVDRDYQTGEAQASAGEGRNALMQQDLAAVLTAGDAKALVHEIIAREWSDRDRLTLRLPPSMLGLKPGDCLELELSPRQWRIEKTTIDGFVVLAELRPMPAPRRTIASDAGRIVGNTDIVAGPLSIALLDVRSPTAVATNDPVVLLAVTAAIGWRRQPVEIGFGGQRLTVQPTRAKSILGTAESALGGAGADLIDDQNSVTIALIDQDQWLTSCDAEALAAGENAAVLGSEVIQFGAALPLGGGRFRLSHLLRGRGGSEWACGGHVAGEPFCLLKSGTLQPVALPIWSIGATLSAQVHDGASTAIEFHGESVRPPSPVNLRAEPQANGDLVLTWARGSRQGLAWLDGFDAPLEEANQQYRIQVSRAAGSLEKLCAEAQLTIAGSDLMSLGTGPLSIAVRQIGDLAASRPAQLTISL